jgi:hypothetical protein
MPRLAPLVCASLLVVAVLALRADSPRPAASTNPDQVALASAAALERQDWNAYAETFDAQSLKEFRDLFAPLLKAVERRSAEEQAAVLALFEGATDVKTALAWSPRELFVRVMKALGRLDTARTVLAGTRTKTLGTVLEGNELAHVVIRSTRTMPGARLEKVDVVSLKRSGNEWKLLLPPELKTIGQGIATGLGASAIETGTATDEVQPEQN